MGCSESVIVENKTIRNENDLNDKMEEFLSNFKLNCYKLKDSELIVSQFNFISEEFERVFNKHISRKVLYDYYNC